MKELVHNIFHNQTSIDKDIIFKMLKFLGLYSKKADFFSMSQNPKYSKEAVERWLDFQAGLSFFLRLLSMLVIERPIGIRV